MARSCLPEDVWDVQMEEEKQSAEGAKEAADRSAIDATAEPVTEAAAIASSSDSSAADKVPPPSLIGQTCMHLSQNLVLTHHAMFAYQSCTPGGSRGKSSDPKGREVSGLAVACGASAASL